MFIFAVLDPRPVPAATEANEKIFQNPHGVLGIEVTVPSLAARCTLGNIDPQHNGGDSSLAAIEAAARLFEKRDDPIPDGATLTTVRPDLDSVGGIAIVAILSKGVGISCASCSAWNNRHRLSAICCWSCGDTLLSDPMEGVERRAGIVAKADKFATSGKWSPRPLPTKENPWPEEAIGCEDSYILAAIAAAVADHKVPIADCVSMMERWLLTGEEPEQYRSQVERERADMIAALETGAIKHSVVAGGRIAVVESTYRAATTVGYALAPVVVALNPEFRFSGGEPHRKFTVCQYGDGYADLKSALVELNKLERGWGGHANIVGSPQGTGSKLAIEQVVSVVEKFLL